MIVVADLTQLIQLLVTAKYSFDNDIPYECQMLNSGKEEEAIKEIEEMILKVLDEQNSCFSDDEDDEDEDPDLTAARSFVKDELEKLLPEDAFIRAVDVSVMSKFIIKLHEDLK